MKPAGTEQVAAVVRICAEEAVPVAPWGGNTGMSGAATLPVDGRAVVVQLDLMNRVHAISPFANSITVEAGCIPATTQEAATQAERLFPLSLGA